MHVEHHICMQLECLRYVSAWAMGMYDVAVCLGQDVVFVSHSFSIWFWVCYYFYSDAMASWLSWEKAGGDKKESVSQKIFACILQGRVAGHRMDVTICCTNQWRRRGNIITKLRDYEIIFTIMGIAYVLLSCYLWGVFELCIWVQRACLFKRCRVWTRAWHVVLAGSTCNILQASRCCILVTTAFVSIRLQNKLPIWRRYSWASTYVHI